jgi:hypothetical protein
MGFIDNLSDVLDNAVDSANRMANVAGYRLKLESAKRTRHDALADLGERVLDTVRANPSMFPDVSAQVRAIASSDAEIADLEAKIASENAAAQGAPAAGPSSGTSAGAAQSATTAYAAGPQGAPTSQGQQPYRPQRPETSNQTVRPQQPEGVQPQQPEGVRPQQPGGPRPSQPQAETPQRPQGQAANPEQTADDRRQTDVPGAATSAAPEEAADIDSAKPGIGSTGAGSTDVESAGAAAGPETEGTRADV